MAKKENVGQKLTEEIINFRNEGKITPTTYKMLLSQIKDQNFDGVENYLNNQVKKINPPAESKRALESVDDYAIGELASKIYQYKKSGKITNMEALKLSMFIQENEPERAEQYLQYMDEEMKKKGTDKRVIPEEEDILVRYEDTNLYGPALEMAIDRLIEETTADIKEQIPEKDWREMTREIKKLWIEKIQSWSYLNQNWKF